MLRYDMTVDRRRGDCFQKARRCLQMSGWTDDVKAVQADVYNNVRL